MKNKKFKQRAITALLAAALLGGAGIGIAQATAQPTLTTSIDIPERTQFEGDAGFEKNKDGQTYGIPVEINGQIAEPDLIRAYATNGKLGYMKNSERKVATGDPSIFKSPEEALRWQENRGDLPVTVPIYDIDGVTEIGIFEFSTGQPTGMVK
ncbi:hypothetical protein ACIPWF_12465 [Paenarthrobacter sp. NPDC089989]|uniref:hypothetical protein n=1 Tax=unclassified Paenarthrobacter TaxID=2634190 RepID=UPI0037F58540